MLCNLFTLEIVKKSDIVNNLHQRLLVEVSKNNPLRYLLEYSIDSYIDQALSTLYLYTRPSGSKSDVFGFTEMICAIGHAIRKSLKQKVDSSSAAKTGAFFLYTIEHLGAIEVFKGSSSNGHAAYLVRVTNDDAIAALWSSLKVVSSEKLPCTEPPIPWSSSKHASGLRLVKTDNQTVLKTLLPETHPEIFKSINRSQETGWSINNEILNLYDWAITSKSPAFSDIWDARSPEARTTKLREVKAISSIAKSLKSKTFYHLYYYDFRGRKYPASAYLHEQGADFARGLLLRSEGAALTKIGFDWLLIHLANTWASTADRPDGLKTDKIPIHDRISWSLNNEDKLLSYAINPRKNKGWTDADQPWQFLAACFELRNLREYQLNKVDFSDFNYVTRLVGYIDGSNNGCQHLAALTRDEVTAKLVNLKSVPIPEDLYRYVGTHTWDTLKRLESKIPTDELKDAQDYVDSLLSLKKAINAAPKGSELRASLVSKIREFKAARAIPTDSPSIVYWLRISEQKEIRKICKR